MINLNDLVEVKLIDSEDFLKINSNLDDDEEEAILNSLSCMNCAIDIA